jgi:MFS family permease
MPANRPGQSTATRAESGLGGDFWRFFAGQTISNLGSSVTLFALPLLVYELTGSALNLGITTAAAFLPYLLFGLVIGAWVDRLDRKRLMIAVDVGRALVVATIPLLAALDTLRVEWIYLAAFVNSTLTIAFDSAEFAAIPSLVGDRDLVTANGRIQASYAAAQIAGPLLAGGLAAAMALEAVLLVDAASFLVSAASLSLIRRRFNVAEGTPRRGSIRRDVVEGLRYVLSHPVLRSISLMMALINFFGTTIYAQTVLFAKERFAAGDAQVSLLFSAGSAGTILLALAAGPLRKRLRFAPVALGALLLDGALTIALAFTPYFWVALPLQALIAGLGTLFNINTGSLRQTIVPNHLLGRVITIAGVLAWSANPLGALAGGWAIEQTGDVSLVFAAIGAITCLIAAAFWLFSPLGHAEDYLPTIGAPGEPATSAVAEREPEEATRLAPLTVR